MVKHEVGHEVVLQCKVAVIPLDIFVARKQGGSGRKWEAGVGHRGDGRVGMKEGVQRCFGQYGWVDGMWVRKPVWVSIKDPERRGNGSHHMPPTSRRCSYNTISRLSCSSSWRSTRARSIARPALPAPTMATDLFPCATCHCRGTLKSPRWRRRKLTRDKKNWRMSNMLAHL